MIEKISSIKDLAVFKDFEWDKSVVDDAGRPLSFGILNIIYGRNYSGKTSISRVVRAFETHTLPPRYEHPSFALTMSDGTVLSSDDLQTHIAFRVFNEDFVRANLTFMRDQNGEISPFPILGDDNGILSAEIKDIEDVLGSSQPGRETGLYAELVKAKADAAEAKAALKTDEDAFDKQLSDKAIKNPGGIKYQSNRFGDQNYNITKLKEEIATVIAPSYIVLTDAQVALFEAELTDVARPELPPLPNIIFDYASLCDDTRELLARKIGESTKIQELVNDFALNKWVEEGCKLNSGRVTCAFCGAPITDTRWETLKAHFDEETQQLKADISTMEERLNQLIAALNSQFIWKNDDLYTSFHSRFIQCRDNHHTTVQCMCDEIGKILLQLEKRRTAITIPADFVPPLDLSTDYAETVKACETLRGEANGYGKTIGSKRVQSQKALRLHAIRSFTDEIAYSERTSEISRKMENLTAKNAIVDEIRTKITTYIEKIDEKRNQMNDEAKGADAVNGYLSSHFGHHDISLLPISDISGKTIRFDVVRNGKTAYNLSEGECSLVAFCYFVAKLHDTSTDGKKPIIWIDDPISSLDDNHIFYLFSLLSTEIMQKGIAEQTFISTHNLEFLKYLRRLGNVKAKEKKYWVIDRISDHAVIREMPKYMQQYGTEFNYLFSRIYECAKLDSTDDTNYDVIYDFGNNARKFLESYLYFKYPYEDKNEYNLENRLKLFFANDATATVVGRVINEYSHLQGAVEKALCPVDKVEIIRVANIILEKIKEDPEQYKGFLNSLGIVTETTIPLLDGTAEA